MVQRMLVVGLVAATFCFACFWISQARAQDISKALLTITETADRICGIVNTFGGTTSMQARGNVRAELNTLIKQLADLGITVSGDLSKDTYDGVVRSDLPETLSKVRQCKERVFNTLQEKLIPSGTRKSSTLGMKSNKLPDGCDPDWVMTPANAPNLVAPGVNTYVIEPDPRDPCSPLMEGTWKKSGGVWRRIAD